ncbi:MAG: UDP-N-acetylmuramate dehydrogenase [Clostridia bacterium]|nr:UDP-N-acetylmuramate dehydrogenase [Clostridia bacterium]
MRDDNFSQKIKCLYPGDTFLMEPLSDHVTWKIGGPADVLHMPSSVPHLKNVLEIIVEKEVPLTIIGRGSNLLVLDKGVRGLVVKLSRLKDIRVEGNEILASAGVSLPYLSRIALENSLSGLEFAVGIPAGTAGAVINNAGAHGGSMQDIVKDVTVMDLSGEIRILDYQDLAFGYRQSSLKNRKNYIVLKARLGLQKDHRHRIRDKMERYMEHRRQTQPLGAATAGCVFSNPKEGAAGYFIERAGFKGHRIGDAKVSTRHANFIINTGNAKARDVLILMDKIKRKVHENFGIILENEIQILGQGSEDFGR